jgi:hypothetical protein
MKSTAKKMGFNRPFVTEDIPNEDDLFIIVKGYWFRDKKGVLHYVRAGTVSDGASIPRLLWTLVGSPRETEVGQAAGVHDVMYREGKYSRAYCDDVLKQGMECLGASWAKRTAIREGLRLGGWVAWNKYRKMGKK